MTEPAGYADSYRLREFLAARDISCPRCRYNLRGLRGNRCPECGATISRAALRQAIRRRGGLPLAVAGVGLLVLLVLVLPAGTSTALVFLGVWLVAGEPTANPASAVLLGIGPTLAMMAGAPLLAARWSELWEARMADLPQPIRWVLAALCWSWVAVGLALWAYFPA